MGIITPNRERFIREIAAGKNQTDAYRIAFPKSRFAKNASVRGSLLASDPDVRAAIQALKQKTADRAEITRDQIVAGITAIAMRKKTRDGDKLKAFELLCKLLGLNAADRHEVKSISMTLTLTPEEKSARIAEVFGIQHNANAIATAAPAQLTSGSPLTVPARVV